MSLGNGNPNEGNKGSNWRYEYNVLKALECIVTNTSGGTGEACCPATNTLLQQIVDNTNDIEVSLGAGDITVELAGVESRLDTVIANQTNGTQTSIVTATNLDIRDLVFATDKVDVSGSVITTSPAVVTLSQFRSLTTSNTGETIKATPGSLYRFNILNTAATAIYVKLYNVAVPTAASTPVYVIAVSPGSGSNTADEFVAPDTFSVAIGIRTVTGLADADATSPATSPIVEIRYV